MYTDIREVSMKNSSIFSPTKMKEVSGYMQKKLQGWLQPTVSYCLKLCMVSYKGLALLAVSGFKSPLWRHKWFFYWHTGRSLTYCSYINTKNMFSWSQRQPSKQSCKEDYLPFWINSRVHSRYVTGTRKKNTWSLKPPLQSKRFWIVTC